MAALFVLGTLLGGLVNLAAYRLAYYQRAISPWSRGPDGGPARWWSDRLPVVGWWGLRREAATHGPGFWLRPALVELLSGAALVGIYWWDVVRQGLYPELGVPFTVPAHILHAQFLGHALLLLLMLAASLIDLDEKLIPDEITVAGTLIGLILAAAIPWSLLPQLTFAAAPPPYAAPLELPPAAAAQLQPKAGLYAELLTTTAPNAWPPELEGRPNTRSLLLGLACYWLWIFAMLHRPWHRSRGVWRAIRIATARAVRDLRRWPILLLLAAGTVVAPAVWAQGGLAWVGLLTALVGMVGAGGMIWIVRIIGAATLKKEAMGFGDVMLMMMVGTFVGWQSGIMIFFLAPFFGLAAGVLQLILRRDQYIPYGPFLCLATGLLVVRWADVWEWGRGVFFMGWLIPAALAVCFGVLALMLTGLHLVREALTRE
jgi:prepilin signal peptidase PulO-like enzyme (type II secretory pathway)